MTSPFSVQKYVLLVDRADGPLAVLAPALKRLDFRVILLPSVELAIEFVRAFPKLAMVVVNPALGGSDETLYTSIRALQPPMPVITVEGGPTHLDDPLLLSVPESISPDDFCALAETALRQHFYPQELVRELVEAATEALGSFGDYFSAGDPFLRANGSQLAPVSSVISFTGERLAGHLVVGSTEQYLKSAYLRMFPGDDTPELSAIVDFLGEISNRTLGRLKSYFESRGVSFLLGVPLGIHGSVALLKASAAPSLGLDLEGLGGRLFVEFCFERFNPDELGTSKAVELLESGKVVFL
jgi:CheY-specific phosphatase CheX